MSTRHTDGGGRGSLFANSLPRWGRERLWGLQTAKLLAEALNFGVRGLPGGQSGGALVNARGGVIGISEFKFSEAGFGLVASAADIAPIVEGLINGQDPWGLNSRSLTHGKFAFEFQVALQNYWDSKAFHIPEGPVAIETEINGAGDGLLQISDVFGSRLLTANNEFTGIEFGRIKYLEDYPHFLRVVMGSGDSSGFDLTSSVALYPIDNPDDGQNIAVSETRRREN